MVTMLTSLAAAVAKWASLDDERRHLRQVMFGARECVALDGHRMVAVPIRNDSKPFSVDPDHLLAAAAAQRCSSVGDKSLIIGAHGDGIRINYRQTAGEATIFAPQANLAEFPKYERFLQPDARSSSPPDGYRLQPRYLAAIAEVEEAAGNLGENTGVRVVGWSTDGLGPMNFEGRTGIKYVVMPMRA